MGCIFCAKEVGYMYTNVQLVAFVLNALALGTRYWFGTFGVKASTSLYNSKKGQYPGHYTSARAAQYKADIAAGKMVTDCMGLIKWFFWSQAGKRDAKYADGFPDISANQCIASYCEQTGKIGTLPEIPGLVLWCDGHIGVYIGNGYAIEARGFAYGVVKTKVANRSWTKWGKIKAKYLTYVDDAPAADTDTLGARVLKLTSPLTKGGDVQTLQRLLIGWGFSCGKWGADGEFGSGTQAAVVAWQYANGLPETGIVDADDYTMIDKLLNPVGDDADDADEPEAADEDDVGDVIDEPDAPRRYVGVTSGNTVNVRTVPNTGAVLGVAYLGDVLDYLGVDSEDGWHLVAFADGEGWISGKYTTLADELVPVDPPTIAPPTQEKRDAVVVDTSQHNNQKHAKNDWPKIAKNVDLMILRCGVTRTDTAPIGIGIDAEFAYAAKKCKEHGIPFGVYYYGKVKTADEARKEARKAFETASPHKPLFYAYDVEEGRLTDKCILAWADELRKLGVKKVGMYIGHNYYPAHKGTVSAFDFIWIPRYGKNDGKFYAKYVPAYPCDIHQYTSVGDGKALGFYDNTVDVNRLTGSKPLSWFLKGE